MILFVVEGARAEPLYLSNIKNALFPSGENIDFLHIPKEGTIHSIAKVIADDPDVDTFSLILDIVEDPARKMQLKEEKGKVSEIYFIFDYDGHAHDSSDENLLTCLEVLKNETEEGKLYISYPMIESNRHIKCEDSFSRSSYPIESCSNYKKFVHEDSDKRFHQFKKFTKNDWLYICGLNYKKANFVVNDIYEMPNSDVYSTTLHQIGIFKKQKNKQIDPLKCVYILGSFPFFIADYFGINNLDLQV